MNHEATIATLNMQLDNCAKDLYEKDKRIAELECQLAAPSAPAVEPQPVAVIQQINEVNRTAVVAVTASNRWDIDVAIGDRLYAAPQAADTDKVRGKFEHVATAEFSHHRMKAVLLSEKVGYTLRDEQKLFAFRGNDAELAAFMAAQAPVREVPDTRPGIEAVVALIQKQCDDYHREHGSQEPDTGVWNYPGDGNEWMCDREELLDEIRALLPAAPVQQEGDL